MRLLLAIHPPIDAIPSRTPYQAANVTTIIGTMIARYSWRAPIEKFLMLAPVVGSVSKWIMSVDIIVCKRVQLVGKGMAEW